MEKPDINDFVILDLDGTLCNTAHREHLARARQWEEFHSLLEDDTINEGVATATACFAYSGLKVIVLTGRPERFRKRTEYWLAKHRVSVHITAILMRSDDDYRPDGDMKADWLARFFGSLEDARRHVLCILDDRDKVVEDLRNKGFMCWQVQPGGY